MIGYVLYTTKTEPGTIRTHSFNSVTFWPDGLVAFETDSGIRDHIMHNYIDFGIFPTGPENQTKPPQLSENAEQ